MAKFTVISSAIFLLIKVPVTQIVIQNLVGGGGVGCTSSKNKSFQNAVRDGILRKNFQNSFPAHSITEIPLVISAVN